MKLSLERKIIWACLALGALLRAWLAVSEFGLIHADEQFQTLEPASRLVYGFGTATWEWIEGSRSWIVPLLYVPVLGALKAAGITGGSVAIAACRLWMVLFSLLTIWRFHRLLEIRGAEPAARLLTLAFLCLLPAMIYWGPATFSDSWATFFLWAALCQAALYFEAGRKADALAASALFALTILVRIQLLPWAGSALLLLFFLAKDLRKEILAAAALPVFAAGMLDWLTWGMPFWSYYWNLVANLLQGAADSNGTMPWWAYPRLLAENLGRPVFLLTSACYLACLAFPRRWQKIDYLLFVPGLLHLLAHSAIPHKETRFLLPMIPLLFYSFALAASEALRRWRGHPAPLPSLILLSAAVFSFGAEETLDPKTRYNELDISALHRQAYEDGLLARYPESCLLLVHELWLWSRGELGSGRELRVRRTKNLFSMKSKEANECSYAILPKHVIQQFLWLANSQQNWRQIGEDRWGHFLFRNDRPPLPPTGEAALELKQ